jgi:pantetheine-phosphate adenylyltransferase
MPNVEVIAFEGLLVDAVKQLNADAILRGLRAFSDFEYELQMALMNRELLKGCETIFLTPQLENSYVSSTLVKEVARLDADFTAHVPAPVARALMQRRKSL